jgi:hypothetical protein
VKNHLIRFLYLDQIQTIIVKNLTKTHILKEPNLETNVEDPDLYHIMMKAGSGSASKSKAGSGSGLTSKSKLLKIQKLWRLELEQRRA